MEGSGDDQASAVLTTEAQARRRGTRLRGPAGLTVGAAGTGDVAFASLLVLLLTLGPVYTVRLRWPFVGVDLIDDSAVQSLFFCLDAVALAVLAHRRSWRRLDRVGAGLVAALCALVLVSGASSLQPQRTYPQALILAGTAVVACYLAASLTPRGCAVAAAIGLHVGAVWSAWAIWRLHPTSQDANGRWVGIYFNRNSLGPVAALAAVVAVVLACETLAARRSLGAAWLPVTGGLGLLALLDLRLLIGSRSATPAAGMVLLLVALAFGLVGARVRLRPTQVRAVSWAALGALAVAAWWWASNLDRVLGWFGKDRTIFNRTGTWRFAYDTAMERPLRGWGFLAPWIDPTFVESARAATKTTLQNAHNGWIEVLIGAGLPALALFCAVVGLGVVRGVRRSLLGRRPAQSWVLLCALWGVVENLTETFVMGNTLVWMLLVWAVVMQAPAPGGRGDEPTAG